MKKIATGIASGALFLGAFVPAAFATTVNVSGNGSYSMTDVGIHSNNSTTVSQNTTSTVVNDVTTKVSTGNNESNGNTGTSSTIHSGDGSAIVEIENGGNTNTATVNDCGCPDNTNVQVQGNGTHSNNVVDLWMWNKKSTYQRTNSDVSNMIDTHVYTGGNETNHNTSPWWMHNSSTIHSGDGLSAVSIKNWGSTNTIR